MNEVVKQRIIPADLAGQRLDKASALVFPEYSRSEVSQWLKDGALTLDGARAKPKHRVSGGEALDLQVEETRRESWHEPVALEFEVLYEDEDLIVVNKPAGLVVHPGAGNPTGTLVNGLLHHRSDLSTLPRAGVVHRLDKDTSGIMVVAASEQGLKSLSAQVSDKSMQRRYLAVCEGRMVAGQDVDAPIGRHPTHRTRQAVREDGKPAQTRFRVEERYRAHSLLRAELATGRTHQIRVHLQSIGFPLVGDGRYGARRRVPAGADAHLLELLQGFPRQALHAWQLALEHPRTAESLAFEAPLPVDMTELCQALRDDDAE